MRKILLSIVFLFALVAVKAQSPVTDTKSLSDSTLRYGNEIYENTDVLPSPPGGIAKFRGDIQIVLKQPLKPEKEPKGEIRVSFIIERDGKITDLKVLRWLASTEKTVALLRFIKTRPNWNPGLIKNMPVRARVILSTPVTEAD